MDAHTLPATAPSPTPALQDTAGPTLLGLQADLPTVALQQMWGQNYEGAVETWAQVIQQDPGNHQAYIEARMLADEGERQEAPLSCPHTATA